MPSAGPDREPVTATAAPRGGGPPRDDATVRDSGPELASWSLERAVPERFQVRGRLGRGGMAVVLEVHDAVLDRDVALKLMAPGRHADPAFRARFLREGRAAATLDHPAVVRVYDIDPEAGFIVMELVRGQSLQARLREVGKLPPDELARLADALLGALAAAHARGIVHRDVKPGNLLIAHDGAVRLADFGIASFGDSDLTSTRAGIGTPAYMPPEQLRGRGADPRVDVYAAGATLFEAATGQRLHGSEGSVEDPEAVVRAVTGDAGLAAAIARAVREKPAERFADASEFAAALARPRRTRRSQVRRGLLGLAGLLAIGLAVGVGIPLLRAARGGAPAPVAGSATIAMLPLVDRTGDPLLDYARTGVPHLLGGDLGRIPGIQVRGYYALRERIPAAQPDDAAWLSAARALSATLVVRGELSRVDGGVRLELTVSELGGRVITREARTVTRDEVPEAARELAAPIAAAVLGRPVRTRSGPPRSAAFVRELELAVAALAEQDIETASPHLEAALALEPNDPDALHARAVERWWKSMGPPEVAAAVMRALAAGQEPDRRAFLIGLALLNRNEYPRVIEHFQRSVERYPESRDLVYGLFEAQFHGGLGAEAMQSYRRLGELSPRFSLGNMHALSYYLVRGDREGIAWALGRADVFGSGDDRAVWGARAAIAVGDRAGALALLSKRRRPDGSLDFAATGIWAQEELLATWAVDGRRDQIAAVRGQLWPGLPVRDLGLAIWEGDVAAAGAARRRVRDEAARLTGRQRLDHLERWATVELAAGERARLAEVLELIDAAAADDGGALNVQAARALLGGALGQRQRVDAAAQSSFPLVAAVGAAYQARRGGDLAGAAEAWTRAVAADTDGRWIIVTRLELARTLHELGRRAELAAVCAELVTPRVFDWSWGGAAPQCRAWTEVP